MILPHAEFTDENQRVSERGRSKIANYFKIRFFHRHPIQPWLEECNFQVVVRVRIEVMGHCMKN